jgi:hypothetical protein
MLRGILGFGPDRVLEQPEALELAFDLGRVGRSRKQNEQRYEPGSPASEPSPSTHALVR